MQLKDPRHRLRNKMIKSEQTMAIEKAGKKIQKGIVKGPSDKEAINQNILQAKEEVKKEEIKKEDKKTETKKAKKNEAIVRGLNLPISSKQSFAISKFIKYKEIGQAIQELEEILLHKKALPMKGEIPHRRGKGVMSGRYPKNAITTFIKLLKSLNANANVNEISNPVIFEAYGNFASRPYGKFGRIRKKRSNVVIVAKENTSSKRSQSRQKKEDKK